MLNDSFVLIQESKINKLFSLLGSLKDSIEESREKQSKKLSETWLDNQEVMELLKVSPRTLQNMRDRKVLPFSKISSKLYYKASDVENLLNKNYHE